MKNWIIYSVLFLFTSYFHTTLARGIYIHAEFSSTPDAKAKIVEYISVKKDGPNYIFQSNYGGREERIKRINFRGALSYPHWNSGDSLERIQKLHLKLSSFKKRFPQSARFLNRRIILLKQSIDLKRNGPKLEAGKKHLGTFRTKDNKLYKNAQLVKKNIDGIEIIHTHGGRQIDHTLLPEEILKKVGKFDLEAIRLSKLSPYQLAKNKHDGLLRVEDKEISKLKNQMSQLSKPSPPSSYDNLKQINGYVLNKLPNGFLVSEGDNIFAVVDTNSDFKVRAKYFKKLAQTNKKYTYPTMKKELHTVSILKQPEVEILIYEKALKNYNNSVNQYKSDIITIQNKAKLRLINLQSLQ